MNEVHELDILGIKLYYVVLIVVVRERADKNTNKVAIDTLIDKYITLDDSK